MNALGGAFIYYLLKKNIQCTMFLFAAVRARQFRL